MTVPASISLDELVELALELAAHLRPFDGQMLPALERAILERSGERVPRDVWDLRSLRSSRARP
ncbi:MAG TPA: hypothetical protein VHN14_06125 [Kofleriaceae bacterium]|nr:hypothetical protein [Kofleriaceae bacterium]